MKIEMLNEDDTPVAIIESAIGQDGRDHGVVISGPSKDGTGLAGNSGQIASDAVNATREILRVELGRKPRSDEIVAAVAKSDPKRFVSREKLE